MVTSFKVKTRSWVKTRFGKHRCKKYGNQPPNCHWPHNIEEAHERYSGPYTAENVSTALRIEPLEIYNGWLTWQDVIDYREYRLIYNIHTMLNVLAKNYQFGEGYLDRVQCLLENEDVFKPSIAVISKERFESQVTQVDPESESNRWLIKGSPELVIEVDTYSHRGTKGAMKRQGYFENGTLVFWDVNLRQKKIRVYEVENPQKAKDYRVRDIIGCERVFPEWQQPVADFFLKRFLDEENIELVKRGTEEELAAEGAVNDVGEISNLETTNDVGEISNP
ncbi:MAG: Uma2 family endonuclease, partial [Chloroflexi bacterium]|nr:Uma2 family endonuclease [Chloroflexota bacterium]